MLDARYEDDEILIIDKPAGLATQLGAGLRISVVEAVERDFGFKPFLVHRLDKETAGLLVVAKDSRSAAIWTASIGGKSVRKFYRAIVSGEPRGDEGVLTGAVAVRGEEKSALTRWRLLESYGEGETGRFSYLELELGTGRTHQIRLHLAGAGLPILGDESHGDFRLNKRLKKERGLKRLLLISYELRLPGGLVVRASIPDYFSRFLASFEGAFSEGKISSASRETPFPALETPIAQSETRGGRVEPPDMPPPAISESPGSP